MDNKLVRKFKDLKYRINLLEKKQKNIYIGIFAGAIVLITTLIIVLETSQFSSVKLNITNSAINQSVLSLNKAGKSGKIKNQGLVYYKFTEKQRQEIEKFYNENTNAALKLRIFISPTKKQFEEISDEEILPFDFGFLNQDDFSGRKFKFKKYGRVLVKADLQQIFSSLKQLYREDNKKIAFGFDVSLAVPKKDKVLQTNNIPMGFYIDSSLACSIEHVTFVPAVIGFDFSLDDNLENEDSKKYNFYGFSSTGGKLNFFEQKADFSGASQIFPVQFTSDNVMPQITIKFQKDCEKSTVTNPINVGINIGGEKIKIKCVENLDKIVIPTAGVNAPFSLTEVFENGNHICAIIMEQGALEQRITESGEILVPIKTDPGLILDWNQKNWRCKDYEIYQWDRFSDILFFDIRDLKIQEKFFSRLAYFVEKEGYRGRILSNEELEGKHGYNAHDYSAESLASFFNKAAEINFQLNKEEEILKKILLENDIISIDETNSYKVKAKKGGLVSISKETPAWSRKRLLAHEGWHNLFFTDEDYRNFVAATFYTMDPSSREFLIGFFKSQPSLGYDVNDSYLLTNEFMAYILQQPLDQVAKYFTGVAGWGTVMKAEPKLSKYIRQNNAQAFEDAAIILNEYIFDRWGIESGNISLISYSYK